MPQPQKFPIENENGQVFVLLVVVMVAILGFASLVFDVGSVYNERRAAQNAADNAALAGASAICANLDFNAVALDMADRNGFDNDGTTNTVTVNSPPASGGYAGQADYVEVIIFSTESGKLSGSVFGGNMDVTTSAVAHCIENSGGSGYTMFTISEGCSQAIDMTGSNKTVIGGVHTNTSLRITGSNHDFEGIVTTVDGYTMSGSGHSFDPTVNNPSTTGMQPDPVGYPIADYAPGGRFAPGGANAAAAYHDFSGEDITPGTLDDRGLRSGDTISDGLYYTDQDWKISGSNYEADHITVVAEGEISFSGSGHEMREPYVNGLLFFSNFDTNRCNQYGVDVSGSGFIWNGVIYAPRSGVDFSGSGNNTYNGSIVAQFIDISGSDYTLQYDADYLPPAGEDVIELAE